jgi:hypothetical protein
METILYGILGMATVVAPLLAYYFYLKYKQLKNTRP